MSENTAAAYCVKFYQQNVTLQNKYDSNKTFAVTAEDCFSDSFTSFNWHKLLPCNIQSL